jgi:hypothetical protein
MIVMAKPDRMMAYKAIMDVFNHESNVAAFKRMLFDEAAKDIKVFYKEFVVPTMPKDMKLEIEGNIAVTDLRGLLGNALVLDGECSDVPIALEESSTTLEADIDILEELTTPVTPAPGEIPGVNSPYFEPPAHNNYSGSRFPLEEV